MLSAYDLEVLRECFVFDPVALTAKGCFIDVGDGLFDDGADVSFRTADGDVVILRQVIAEYLLR